jgi:hypothetical protein
MVASSADKQATNVWHTNSMTEVIVLARICISIFARYGEEDLGLRVFELSRLHLLGNQSKPMSLVLKLFSCSRMHFAATWCNLHAEGGNVSGSIFAHQTVSAHHSLSIVLSNVMGHGQVARVATIRVRERDQLGTSHK